MTPTKAIINGEEHIGHLRTVHFSLVAASLLLIGLTATQRDGELARAQSQLDAIDRVSRNWKPNWLDTYTLARLPAASGTLPVGWSIGQFIPPGGSKDGQTRPAMSFEFTSGSLNTVLPLPGMLDSLYRFAKFDLTAPSTLSEFHRLWDLLDTRLAIRRITAVKRQGERFEVGYEDSEHDTTITAAPVLDSRASCQGTARAFAPQHPLTDAFGVGFGAVSAIGLCLDTTQRLNGATLRKRWRVYLPVETMDSAVVHGQTALTESHNARWRNGKFNEVFPDLARVTTQYESLSLLQVARVLEDERKRAPDMIDVFGARLPTGVVRLWGLPLLVVIQVYLLVHLQALARNAVAIPEDGLPAWVGLYDGRLARTVTAVSLFILPPMTALILLLGTGPSTESPLWKVFLNATASLIVILAILTARVSHSVRALLIQSNGTPA
jgi:hypothetical protein